MMSEVKVRALDHDVIVRAPWSIADVLGAVLDPLTVEAFEPASQPERISFRWHGADRWALEIDEVTGRPMDPGRALARLMEHINRQAAQSLQAEVPLHAAGLEHPAGGVVAVVGGSGAGKSTLAAAAIRSGWGFVAEEITAVDPLTQAVRPYHRPIGLRPRGARAIEIRYPSDVDWYREVYPWPVPVEARRPGGRLVGAVLVHRRDGGAEIADLSPAQALTRLIEHTVVPASERITAVFRQLDALVRVLPVVTLEFATPTDGVAAVDRLLRRWVG